MAILDHSQWGEQSYMEVVFNLRNLDLLFAGPSIEA